VITVSTCMCIFMLQAELHTSTKPPAEWPAQGKVELKNYSLRYRPETDLVLKGIDVSVRKGEKVQHE